MAFETLGIFWNSLIFIKYLCNKIEKNYKKMSKLKKQFCMFEREINEMQKEIFQKFKKLEFFEKIAK